MIHISNVLRFLEILLEEKVDYTCAFRKLSVSLENTSKKKEFLNLFNNKKRMNRIKNKKINPCKMVMGQL